ncbi:MAG: hypothetical protein ACOZFS_04895 [Thermodesulfobacteriota bacterium]
MNDRKDLTRWNRAGLSRFRYLDGNAVTFLEELRQAFIARFSDAAAHQLQWEALVPQNAGDPEDAYERLLAEQQRLASETERQRLDRLGAQYDAKRQDWAWELARLLARSCHVLGEYLDKYANEGFLRTASQWDNVRRLVEMLDFHPSPPVSATTLLVLEAAKDAQGVLEPGFQVKYSPPDGGKPVIFETLDMVELDSALNQLRPTAHDRNQTPLGGHELLLNQEIKDLTIGEPLVLEDEQTGALRAYRIEGSQAQDGATLIRVSPRISHRLRRGYTKVHLKPKERLLPIGPAAQGAEVKRVLHLTEPPQTLIPGMIIYITDGVQEYYRRLVQVRGRRLVCNADVGPLQIQAARVAQPVTLTVSEQAERPHSAGGVVTYTFKTAGDWSYLANRRVANNIVDDQGKKHLPVYTVTAARYQPVEGTNVNKGYTLLTVIHDRVEHGHNFALKNPQSLLAPPAIPGNWQVDTYLEKVNGHLPPTIFASLPKKTSVGDLAVVASGNQMAWARLEAVSLNQDKEQAALVAENAWEDRGGPDFFLAETVIYAHFKEIQRLKGWQANTLPLQGNRLPLPQVPAALKKGQLLMIENSQDEAAAFFTTIAKIEPNALVLAQVLPAGFTYHNTLATANVVRAGHGETKTAKVLGSGSASQSNQAFILAEDKVSFIADATQPAGVRAAIQVNVAGSLWEQTGSFQDSGPTDPHFTVRMTEPGHLKLTFGDGRRGRRLPTGNNNVRITYRQGTGLAGNLPAGSLAKPVKPHRLVAGVRQPLPATGGNDQEGLDSLRANAPATLLTLDRAVSLSDFSYLVMSHSSVWQARAFYRPPGLGRNVKIDVVVVPAGGGGLGPLTLTLTDFLLARAIPGVEVNLLPYLEQTFDLEVLLAVDTEAFNPEEVAATVKTALEAAFSLKKRKLGQDLFLSEVFQVVEGVAGVSHSQVVINGDAALRRVRAADREVLTLGKLLVDYQGSPAALSPAPEAGQPSAPPALPLVASRPVSIIQGVGARYTQLLRAAGVRTLADLHRLDPARTPQGLSPIRLAEFQTKAGLLLALDLDKSLATPLLSRSLADLLSAPVKVLALSTGLPVPFLQQVQSRLRVLQIALDETQLATLTLRELLTERSAK